MAKIYLDANDSGYNIVNNNTKIFGTTGTQSIVIAAGLTGVEMDSSVEGATFAGNLGDYTFKQVGVSMEVYKGGTLVTTFQSPNQTPTFADGVQDIGYAGGIMRMGGTTFIDGANPVSVSGGGVVTVSDTGINTYTLDMSKDNTSLADNIISFPSDNLSMSNTNLSDGEFILLWNDGSGQNSATVTLTGLTSTQDTAAYSVEQLDVIFGTGTIKTSGTVTSNDKTDITLTSNTTAVAGVAENFIYAIDSSSGSTISQLTSDITLSGFTTGEDTLTFNDVSTRTVSTTSFVSSVIISASSINNQTDIIFNEDSTGNSYQLTLSGVVDDTLSTVGMTVA